MLNKNTVKANFIAMSLILLVFSDSRAQVTLNSTHFATVSIGIDSMRVSLHNATLPVLTPATGAIWDMSLIVDSLPYFWDIRVPSTTYQYADSNEYTFGTFRYQGNAGVNITGSGIIELEIALKEKEYNLATLTIDPYDTLFIPEQTVTYSSPLVHVGFPANYGSEWQSNYISSTIYELTLGIFSYVHKPIERRSYIQRRDTVRGWGKMRVRSATGLPSDYFDVLQVHSTTITTDSFFTDGAPALPSVLTIFNVQQGIADTLYTQRYYRAQEVTPFATVAYSDAGYSQPIKVTTHIQRLTVVGLDEVTDRTIPEVYPNPVTGNVVYVTSLPATGESSYLLTDIAGKEIGSGQIDKKETPIRIKLPASVTSGCYTLSISNNNVHVYTCHLNVVK